MACRHDRQPDQWLCFHCGDAGHGVADCASHSAGAPRGRAGLEAYEAYLTRRRAFSASREGRNRHGGKGRNPEVRDRLESVAEWMHQIAADEAVAAENDGENGDVRALPTDPILALVQLSPKFAGAALQELPQRDRDLRNAAAWDVVHAYRAHFDRCATRLTEQVAARLGVAFTDDGAGSAAGRAAWHEELGRAVREGSPADFSGRADGDGTLSLGIYTVGKLAARCRQLHHLVLDDNHLSAAVRNALLPSPPGSSRADKPIRVCSVGGGPGYDHVALGLVARFLARVQGSSRARWKARNVETQVFDLFDEEWLPIAEALGKCYEEQALADDENEENATNGEEGFLTMHHADIRRGLDDPPNCDGLRSAVEVADIICFQFVLHENASFLSAEQGEGVGGAVVGILDHAAVGSLVLCTDSNNTLWPSLKKTAAERGWRCFSDAEKGGKITMGPSNFVILQRVENPLCRV